MTIILVMFLLLPLSAMGQSTADRDRFFGTADRDRFFGTADRDRFLGAAPVSDVATADAEVVLDTDINHVDVIGILLNGNPATYTLNSDFDMGALVNVNHDIVADQLQLNNESKPFDFIWVAASGRGTIVKIDTKTGEILGEYLSAPNGRGRDPSRTTVDNDGNVWAGNRAESSDGKGSAVRIGLEENCQCQDRNGNGIIDTSTGLGDIRPWTNAGGADNNGGVSTAEDECIINYVRTSAIIVRTVAVDADNNVWIGGPNDGKHELYDGDTGDPIPDTLFYGFGGYGGLIDDNGVLWSAGGGWHPNCLLRYDPSTNDIQNLYSAKYSYGLAKDNNGNIWNSQWTYGRIFKYAPDGTKIGDFSTGGSASRGVAVTSDDDIWVANSNSNTVTRLSNDGTLKATIPVGNTPTGVAVDSAGKVWVTNYGSHTVMRIDPATNTVDLVVSLGDGAYPYDYSDMTGSTLIAPPNTGTWTVVHDSGVSDTTWRTVSWNADVPEDSELKVQAATSNDGTHFGPFKEVTNGEKLEVDDGRYIKVAVNFERASTSESPVLYDLTIAANQPPDCSNVVPSNEIVWPPNHAWVSIDVIGITDPDGDIVSITIDSIYQDEPVDTFGDGTFTPDGDGIGTATAQVRAERTGTSKVPGNGRVYHINFTADDGYGGECGGEVLVKVPHDKNKPAIDDGALYDSTSLSP